MFRFALNIAALAILLSACKNKQEPKMEEEIPNAMEENFSDEFVPQWAKSAIWYQVFPDRFRNGDPSNDPKVENIMGADPMEPPKVWQIHPWGSDWYKLQDYELANGEPEYWKHILRRRYGGDLQGVIDKLDYIKELGINAIYLNPVFEAPSLHKYDGATYHHIDPNFGPDPDGDRALMATEDPSNPTTWVWTKADLLALELIEKAHAKGIRVIFDGVFNHMGINSFAFKDLKEKQEESKYKDWFTVKSFDNPEKGTEFDYKGWWGVKSLPELKEDENGIVEGPKNYIFAATERWMKPKGVQENGIDGWRLDVAFCVDHAFWKDWRVHVRDLNPEAYLVAEIVDVPEKVVPYMQGDEFDGEMNYNFVFTCAEYFLYEDSMRIDGAEFDKKLKELRELYPKGVAYVNQNLLGSHDANRISSMIKNRGIGNYRDWGTYFGISKAIENPDYDPRKPSHLDYDLQKLLVMMQMTYVGAPMVYYGDEIGMWGANDPDCRKPMIWDDIEYEDEITFPNQTNHTPDKISQNKGLLAFYKKMIGIRNAEPALQLGTYDTFYIDGDLFGFERSYKGETIWVVFNRDREKIMPVSLNNFPECVVDLMTNNTIEQEGGILQIDVPALGCVILKGC
ncbi:MAG: glycoside hydrolase family 13 protein [Bacteroidia bacterium]